MKTKRNIPAWVPYVVAIVLFLALSMLYFAPQFEGKTLAMGDITQYEGMSRDIKQMQKTTGEDPQWTGAAFSGMPAYMINIEYPSMVIKNWSTDLANAFGRPAVLIFLALVSFWVMLLLWGMNPLVAIVPAIAYGFSTYSILIIGAGHITKMFAFAYAPLLVGGVMYTLRGRHMVLGGLLTALFAALQIAANHPQITYYFGIVIVAAWVNELVTAIRTKAVRHFTQATVVLALAAVLAVGANLSSLYYTAQHQPDTIRGGSELAEAHAGDNSSGLDIDYATAWSYGRTESLNMFIPNLMGGSSSGGFAPDGEVASALRPYGARGLATQLPAYWGDQPMTAGPTYVGAVALFLAVLALVLLRGREKWWLVVVSLFAWLLSLGSNLMWFTELMFEWLPAYDKFRAVSTALVVVQWSVPLLAALVLWRVWRAEYDRRTLLVGVGKAAAVLGGLALLFVLAGRAMFSFAAPYDGFMGLPADVLAAMQSERASMLVSDALRSLIFVVLAGGLVALYAVGKMGRWAMVATMGVLVGVDMIGVDRRYLAWDDFVTPMQTTIQPTEANKAIMSDKSLGYRVANLAVSTFKDATTSYFHRSVGGYHGAKLSRYQDLIDHQLLPGNPESYDMLNTKYFIVPDEESGAPTAVLNEGANGAAWFVDEVVWASTPHEEMRALDALDSRTEAVVEERFRPMLEGVELGSGEVELVRYQPNRLVYRYNAPKGGLCVFSEIYYDKGWTAYVDGRESEYLRADYVLRAMVLPAGDHTVEWRFRAPKFDTMEAITLGFSLTILVGLLLCVVVEVLKCRKHKKCAKWENNKK